MKDEKSKKPAKTDSKKREMFKESRISDKDLNITERDVEIVLDSIKRETRIIVEGEKKGLKTYDGEIILPPLFEDIYFLTHQELKKGYKVVAKMHGKYGVVLADGTGTWIVNPEFDYIGYPNNITHVRKDGKWGVLDISKGEYIIAPECETVYDNDGFLFCNRIGFYKKDGKYGVLADWGSHTEPVFEEVEMDPDGNVKVKYNGQWGFIGEDNKFTAEEEEAYYFFEE